MSANLRRSLHDDLVQQSFRDNVPRYLESFGDLVEETWNTFRELQTFTTGHNLDIMFADRSRDVEVIQAAMPESDPASTKEGREQLAHLMSLARKGGVYAIPATDQATPESPEGMTWICFQLLGFNPGNRKYMERLTQWSVDDWKGTLSCAILGNFVVSSDPVADADAQGPIVPSDLCFKSVATVVQPLTLGQLFMNNTIDHMHEFLTVNHKTEFDAASVQEILSDPISDEPVSDDLACFVST